MGLPMGVMVIAPTTGTGDSDIPTTAGATTAAMAAGVTAIMAVGTGEAADGVAVASTAGLVATVRTKSMTRFIHAHD